VLPKVLNNYPRGFPFGHSYKVTFVTECLAGEEVTDKCVTRQVALLALEAACSKPMYPDLARIPAVTTTDGAVARGMNLLKFFASPSKKIT